MKASHSAVSLIAERCTDLDKYATKFNVGLYPPHKAGHLLLSEFRSRFTSIENGAGTVPRCRPLLVHLM